jgi:CRISPR system Cascade subunit CasB
MTEVQTPGSIAMAWWANSINAPTSEARGLSARLRRAKSAAEVLSERKVFDLAKDLSIRDPDKIYAMASTLAHVKLHTKDKLLTRLGSGNPPALSEARFRKLITTPSDGIARAVRMVLPMVDYSCNVAQLAGDIFFFGEETQRRWCFDYFQSDDPKI